MKKKILISLLLVITILTAIFSTVYATDEQAEIPTAYDLRNEMTINVEYQKNGDQEKGAVCYHYAKTKMVETYLQKTKGISYNLSETYYACNGDDKEGVFVLESDFPNKLFAQIGNIDEKVNTVKNKAVVKKFEYLYRIDKTEENIKQYIMKYGGVLTTCICDNQMDNYKGGMYHSKASEVNRGIHGVTIIGWDDNYSKDNFVYEKPQNDGAWLILNAWGSNWADKGTAWISYEDYYNLMGNAELIGSITLADGETIETKLEDKKQEEIKETETPVINQEIIEPNKTSNIQNIFIIVFVGAVILLIIGIILKSKKHK